MLALCRYRRRRVCKTLHDRKNSLFAGYDQGAENWAIIASLLETCTLNSVNPQAWLTDVLAKLVNLWPAKRINELTPAQPPCDQGTALTQFAHGLA